MNDLYYPLPLKSFDCLKEYTLQTMNEFEGKDIYVRQISIDHDSIRMLNDEVRNYGLEIRSALSFKRRGFFDIDDNVHIDRRFELLEPENVHSSLVIPIQGCDGTFMYWLGGEYEETTRFVNDTSPYSHITWLSKSKLIDKVEISKCPMLTKVDIPHSATSRHDNSYRLTLTLRFVNNPRFEEIVKKIQENN